MAYIIRSLVDGFRLTSARLKPVASTRGSDQGLTLMTVFSGRLDSVLDFNDPRNLASAPTAEMKRMPGDSDQPFTLIKDGSEVSVYLASCVAGAPKVSPIGNSPSDSPYDLAGANRLLILCSGLSPMQEIPCLSIYQTKIQEIVDSLILAAEVEPGEHSLSPFTNGICVKQKILQAPTSKPSILGQKMIDLDGSIYAHFNIDWSTPIGFRHASVI